MSVYGLNDDGHGHFKHKNTRDTYALVSSRYFTASSSFLYFILVASPPRKCLMDLW